MKILDVEIKFTVNERLFLITTDSIFFPLLERSKWGEWFVPRTQNFERYKLTNIEFVKDMELEYKDWVERNLNGCS